jgi:L-threonylcarbamoyladenylate synthase
MRMSITKDIEAVALHLRAGGIIGLPTETVYGLAGNALDQVAIAAIYHLKERPASNPLIAHVGSIEQAKSLCAAWPAEAELLVKHFWPGPLTLLVKKKDLVPAALTAGLDRVAIRMPNHPVALDLLSRLPFPLAAPSANPYMRISPTSALQVDAYFGERLEYVLEGGICERGVESTIIGWEDGKAVLYRPGALAQEEIERVIGPLAMPASRTVIVAPGMAKRHYAPQTKLILTNDIEKSIKEHDGLRLGILSFSKTFSADTILRMQSLSKQGDLREAACNLYAALQSFDEVSLDLIIAEVFPEEGLGRTINDRLRRASVELE